MYHEYYDNEKRAANLRDGRNTPGYVLLKLLHSKCNVREYYLPAFSVAKNIMISFRIFNFRNVGAYY